MSLNLQLRYSASLFDIEHFNKLLAKENEARMPRLCCPRFDPALWFLLPGLCFSGGDRPKLDLSLSAFDRTCLDCLHDSMTSILNHSAYFYVSPSAYSLAPARKQSPAAAVS